MFHRYYQDELQYLRELGQEFAQAHPAVAHHLAGPGRDPDVERVLEGFAFLSARIREKLDDEYPELTHGLMQLLWPHYLRPVPSMAILEMQPVVQALRQSQRVPRGVFVDSVDVDGAPCRFRTCTEVVLHPVTLEDVGMEIRSNGRSSLRLSLRLSNQARAEQLSLDRLRIHLHGDPTIAYALYSHLLQHVEETRLTTGGPDARGAFRPLGIEAAGFAEDEALIPYPPTALPGYRHLQEYFALPQKFLFVDVTGLDALRTLTVEDRFQVEVRFDRTLPPTLRPTQEEIRLYCTPIVNLFEHPGDPIRLDRTQTEYRIRPSGKDHFHREVFSIERVSAWDPAANDSREIPSFQETLRAGRGEEPFFYSSRLRTSVVDGRADTYLSFLDGRGSPASDFAETVSIELTCTDRRRPEALRVGDVQVPTDSSPTFVRFRNITVPTPSVAPPLGGDLQWRLISHLALNYLPLVDVEVLRGILELYNFQALRDPQAARANARRLEGLQAVRSEGRDLLSRGAVVRGSRITLDVLEDHFAGEGDLFLFSSILNEFVALQATLNSFVQLQVHGIQGGETLTWPPRTGRDLL